MSRGTAYYDLPNGERIELPTTMPDVEEVPGPLCDGKFELPEAVKEMLSAILVENPPEWSLLSEKALNGILTRASRRGKKLPDLLLTAIHGMIEWWHRGQRGGGSMEPTP